MKIKPSTLGILILCILLSILARVTTPTTAQTNNDVANLSPAIIQESLLSAHNDTTTSAETELDDQLKTTVLHDSSQRKSALRLALTLLALIILITVAYLKSETLREEHDRKNDNHTL